MIRENFKTPLYAAFFCAVLSACEAPEDTGLVQCSGNSTPIAEVQGKGGQSPLQARQVTVRGIVTLVQEDQGLYVEEPASDGDNFTSNALFIENASLPEGTGPGVLITARGTVAEIGDERDTLTALTEITGLVACSTGQPLPLTDVSLPLDEAGREALEGMRIRVDESLAVTDVYQFDRGRFTLSANGIQYIPTEVTQPGAAANKLLENNRANALRVSLPQESGSPDWLASGASTSRVTGVLAHDDRGKRLSLQSYSSFSEPGFSLPAKPAQGVLRVVGANLYNYFNGDGQGRGFPTERGAETFEAFQQQRARIGAAIGVMDPHVIAVMELENDGFGPYSAAQDFIRLADGATNGTWAVARPADDNTGSDEIAVGIFYRADRLKALGPAETLAGPEFERSRQPQAQLFQRLPDGDTLLIVVNHLKSKGSCPDSGIDANQGDGQGCWNDMRRRAARKMSEWANEVAASRGTGNILVLGDMNAYRNEDPIAAIRGAGFTELMDGSELPVHSFAFRGQHGTLDYAFASDALLGQVEQAYIWNVNAAFPSRVQLPQPWLRFSDHDPVVVELR